MNEKNKNTCDREAVLNKCCFFNLLYVILTKSLAIDNNCQSSYLWNNLFNVVQLMHHSQFSNNATVKGYMSPKKIRKAKQKKKS